jgi:prevent-host-death family protein
MKRVSIRELHEKTGDWVRRAESHDEIIITDHGEPVALLAAYRRPSKQNRFSARKILPAYTKVRGTLSRGTETTRLIGADRDER